MISTVLKVIGAILALLALVQPALAQGVVNGGFEAGATAYGETTYRPTDQSPWVFSGEAGVTHYDGVLTPGLIVPEGVLTGFLQGSATITQTFSTSTAGNYFLSLRASDSANSCGQSTRVRISIDGTPVSVITLPRTPPYDWMTAATPSFYLNPGAHTVTFTGLSGASCTAFLDDIQLMVTPASVLTQIEGSFEEWQLGSYSWQYAPGGGIPWTFSANAGVSANGSEINYFKAPQGIQTAFLEFLGHMEQTWTDAGGIYEIRFSAGPFRASRFNLEIRIDGAVIGTFVPLNNNIFSSHTSPSFSLGAGSHTVRFTSTLNQGMVDNILLVRIGGAAVTPGSFNAFDTTVASGSTAGSVQTKVAGSAFSLSVVALNAARTALNTSYTGAVSVQLLDARDSTGALDANGCRSTWTAISGASASGTFVGASAGRINVSLTSNDVWRDVRVRMTEGTNIGCSTDNFAIRPAAIVVGALDLDWQSAFTGSGSPRSLNNTSASGGGVHGAGLPFTLSATALNAAGVAAANYDGAPTMRAGSLACALPTGCVAGSLTFSAWSSAGGGQRLATDATYSEVGTFTAELEDTTFADVDAGDTVSALRTVGQSGGAISVGRFVPAYYDLVPSGVAPALRTMNLTEAVCSAAPAAAPRRSFTYVGQPFGFAVLPLATILARNAAGSTTSNYRGTLWKLGPGQILRTLDATNTTPAGQAASVTVGALSAGDVVSNSNGSGTVTGSSLDSITYTRITTTPASPFTAGIRAQFSVVDTTEAGVTGNPASIPTTSAACFNGGGTCAAPGSGIAFDSAVSGFPGNEFRYGRLRLMNANGSELIALPVSMQAEYWSGSAWVPNTRDYCTTIPVNRVALSNYQRNLGAGETTPSIAGPVVAGTRSIVFSAPGAGNAGSVDLSVDLFVSGANLPWLQGAWTGTTFDQNPAARATFGTFAAPSPIIFRRERY